MNNQHYYINKPNCILPLNQTHTILSNSQSLLFHQSLPVYEASPIKKLTELATNLGVKEIWMKDESSRFGLNAFKVLGASYAINEIIQNNPSIETFCTATDGNHGKAVAWAAALLKKNAIVYMPMHSAKSRVNAIEELGATVIVTNLHYEATCELASADAKINNWQLVQDASWKGYEEIPAYIMSGYLTHFIEMEDSLHLINQPQVDIVFLQAGVGTWAASAVWYYLNRYQKQKPTLVIVEPIESDGILESFKNNQRSSPKGNLQTIMAGLNCGVPSLNAWQIIKNGTDVSMVITDEAVKTAMRLLYKPINKIDKVIAGESGAAGVAALMEIINNTEYSELKKLLNINASTRILCYNTEGDTDPEGFKIIQNGF